MPLAHVFKLLFGDCFGTVDSWVLRFERFSPADTTDPLFFGLELRQIRVRVSDSVLHLCLLFHLFACFLRPLVFRLLHILRLTGVHCEC